MDAQAELLLATRYNETARLLEEKLNTKMNLTEDTEQPNNKAVVLLEDESGPLRLLESYLAPTADLTKLGRVSYNSLRVEVL